MAIFCKTWENGMTTAMICLDLNTSFDTVSHHILNFIMENHFGIESTALKWISSYLENRQFVVQIIYSISSIKVINCSVPQGSILGPGHFSCYVSTLPDNNKGPKFSLIWVYRWPCPGIGLQT